MNRTYEEWLKYYKNATKEQVIEDMMLDIKELKQLKKQKDDIVEYIKKNKKVITKYEAKDTGLPIGTFMWNIDEILRMLGEIDVEN